MSDATQLVCLKCGGNIRTYERNGITIDQCTGCHGIFLDRGELERLISAESRYLGDNSDHGGLGGKHESSGRKKKRDRGFLGELFD